MYSQAIGAYTEPSTSRPLQSTAVFAWPSGPRRGTGHGVLTTDERERLKQLERENVELRRANEILRLASAYFAKAELDRRHK